MLHTVTLELVIEAATPDDARGIAEGAIRHLQETFNDDDSMHGGRVVPVPPPAREAAP